MQPKAPYAACDICPLATRPMCRSAIPANAIAVMIGEAPGIQEIVNDTPFIGETGKILDHMLAHIGINPADLGYTNAVLCRPIGNDDPPDAAIHACAPRLAAELAASRTDTVIALGNVAARMLDMLAPRVVDGGILARAGRTYDGNGYRYTTTVNPAFLMRADSYAPNFARHLHAAFNPPEHPFDADAVVYAVMTPANQDRLWDYLFSFPIGTPCAYDVETDDLQWIDTLARDAAPLLCVVLTLEDWKSVIIPADMLLQGQLTADAAATNRDELRDVLMRYDIIGHNVKFDQNVTAQRLGFTFDATDDTMLMHHTLQELGAHGLKELGSEYLGAPDYEGQLIDSWFKANGIAKDKRKYGMLPKANLYKYAAIDGALTLQLWRRFTRDLVIDGTHDAPYKDTVMPLANALHVVEQIGIKIDRNQLNDARIEFGAELAEIERDMNAIITPLLDDPHITARNPIATAELARLMRTRERYTPDAPIYTKAGKLASRQMLTREVLRYNPSSPQQTHHIIYNLLGLQLTTDLVKPTSTNTGKEALEALPDHPFITLLRRHRRISKMLDTYIEGIDRRADVNDVLHIDFRITGTEIGRLSASNGDHGIPRPDDRYGAMIRSAFIAAPNEVLVMGDYSQAELRAFAWLGNVQFLLDKYRNGQDVHTETALMLEKLGAPAFRHFAEYYARGKAGDVLCANTAKAMRTIAKNVNFGGLVYRGGPNGISGMIGGKLSVQAIADILTYYKPLMPEADIYAEAQYQQLLKRGYVETVFGRRRRFYVISDFNEDDARKAAVHMVVAGSAADLTNTSTVRLVRMGVRVCHTVHDNIIARAYPDEAQDVADAMRQVMQQTGAEYMPGLPWIADIDIADRWCEKPAPLDAAPSARQG